MSAHDTTSTAAAPAAHRRGPVETTILWIAKLGAAAILGYAAVGKLMNEPMFVELFDGIGMGDAGRYLIGGLEILAAILIIIPQSAIYGSFLGLGVMCGAIIGHVTHDAIPLATVWRPLLVGLCCLTILYIRRHDAKFIRNLWDR